MIISFDSDPVHLGQFRQWVEAEWGEVDPFERTGELAAFSLPILAMIGNELAGGLSFTYF